MFLAESAGLTRQAGPFVILQGGQRSGNVKDTQGLYKPSIAVRSKKHRSMRMQVVASSGGSMAAEGGGSPSWFPPPNLLANILGGAAAEEGAAKAGDRPLRRSDSSKRRSVAGIDQDELVDPWFIADADSRFAEFRNVAIHYKRADPEVRDSSSGAVLGQVGLPAVMLHGFGASCFSWERVLRPMANLLGAPALAFDRPAFGLTARTQWNEVEKTGAINPYGGAFSAAATLAFVDLLNAQSAVVIAHSAGALVAASAYLHAPERVAALVLVAPALVPPLLRSDSQRAKEEREARERAAAPKNSLLAMLFMLGALLASALARAAKMVHSAARAMEGLARSIMAYLLRSTIALWLVRYIMDRYGAWAVKFAWFDSSGASQDVLDGYTKPLRCKGWDRALLEFVLAMAASDPKHPPLSQRLHEIKCPVLVVTGDTDRLVPAWNARRLVQSLPNARLGVIKNCGHLPQEEKPKELLDMVQKFLLEEFGQAGQTGMSATGQTVVSPSTGWATQ